MPKQKKQKVVEIWVPTGTPEAEVEAVCQQQIAAGRYPVIYRSGNLDLMVATAELLRHNKYGPRKGGLER